jgi:hypothetical protein
MDVMSKQEQTYKMGKNWLKRFLDTRKTKAGWKTEETGDGNVVVFNSEGKPFALFEPETGLVHTTANIMQVQW